MLLQFAFAGLFTSWQLRGGLGDTALHEVAGATLEGETAKRGPRPNFLYILADDLGYGEISIMPGRTNTNITTPNIDRFFREGMRFTDFYANQECAPSRGSLLTGKHLGHATVRSNQFQASLSAEDITFLELLRDVGGYDTTCIGKWHLAGDKRSRDFAFKMNPVGAPWNKGCSRFYGEEMWNWYYPSEFIYRYNPAGGLQEVTIPANVNASRERCMTPGNTCVWLTDLNLQEALSELDYHKERQDAEAAAGREPAPFFIYLAWTDPHAGVWVDRYRAALGTPVPSNADFAHMDWPEHEKDHAASIHSYHDRYTQMVLDKLDSLGLRDSTVVVYSSDNGAARGKKINKVIHGHQGEFFTSSGPLQGYKSWLTEGGIRVPAAIRWPGRIAAGSVSNEPLALWDMFPTFLDMAGVPRERWPADIDGVSFWQGILQQQPAPGTDAIAPAASFRHPVLYWESCGLMQTRPVWSRERKGNCFTRAVRLGRWKGYQAFSSGNTSELHLYDMLNDSGEETDVSSYYKSIANYLKVLMDSPGIRTESTGGYNYTIGDWDCGSWYGRKIGFTDGGWEE